MKRRFFALVLAMALCLGLAAPAMAAGTGVTVTGPVYLNSTYMLHLNFSDGRARVASTGFPAKYGYIDTSGKLVIPMQYSNAETFHEGLAVVNNDNGTGVIDRDGNVVIPFRDYSLSNFQDGFALGRYLIDDEWKYVLVDKNGKEYDRLEDWMPKSWRNVWREYEDGIVSDILGHELFRLPEGCNTIVHISRQFLDEPIAVINNSSKIAYFDQYGNNLTGFEFAISLLLAAFQCYFI